MIKEFIQDFKNSPYYADLFKRGEVISIYVTGSHNVGITDNRSDIDVTVLMAEGQYWEASEIKYLSYKGKKVHWYFFPIKDLFDFYYKELRILFPIQLRNLREEIVIFENPDYKETLEKLYNIKDQLSTLAMHHLYHMKEDYIQSIFEAGEILESHRSKYLYHLSLASYYLIGDEPDVNFLKAIRRIRWEYVSEEHKAKAFERLQLCTKYIENNSIDVALELNELKDKNKFYLLSII